MRYQTTKQIIVMTGFFAASIAQAEGWLCQEVASQRSGNVVRSCGVGLGADENAARRDAFENARTEFNALCSASTDCDGHEVSVYPERTSCEPESGGGYKCYRLLVFTIGDKTGGPTTPVLLPEPAPAVNAQAIERLLPKAAEKPADAPAEAALPEPAPVRQALAEDSEWRPRIRPFRPSRGAKIQVGMTKAEALERFGHPDVVRENAETVAVFYRGRSFCHGGSCMFRFERETGRVIAYQDFRAEFTDALN